MEPKETLSQSSRSNHSNQSLAYHSLKIPADWELVDLPEPAAWISKARKCGTVSAAASLSTCWLHKQTACACQLFPLGNLLMRLIRRSPGQSLVEHLHESFVSSPFPSSILRSTTRSIFCDTTRQNLHVSLLVFSVLIPLAKCYVHVANALLTSEILSKWLHNALKTIDV